MKLIQDSQVRLVALICQRQGKTAHGHIGANNITFKKKYSKEEDARSASLMHAQDAHFCRDPLIQRFPRLLIFQVPPCPDNTGQRGGRSVIQTMSELQMCFWFLFKSFRAFF